MSGLRPEHGASLTDAIGIWVAKTMRKVETGREEIAAAHRQSAEQQAASEIAKEIAANRMALLVAEGLPIATRREMRVKGRAA